MKKCFICQKEIPIRNGEVCHTCLQFFKWKYGKNYQSVLNHHKESSGGLEKLLSIKSRRKK